MTVRWTALDLLRSKLNMKVVALVFSSLHEEILLNWRTLQRLRIIPEGFPHVGMKAMSVTATPKQQLDQAIADFSSVFDTEGQLKQ